MRNKHADVWNPSGSRVPISDAESRDGTDTSIFSASKTRRQCHFHGEIKMYPATLSTIACKRPSLRVSVEIETKFRLPAR